jgi:hypothetical protein
MVGVSIKEETMKKMTLLLVVLLLAAFSIGASADMGDNPHSFEVDMNCNGNIVHVTVPVITSLAARVEGDGIATPFTHYIDFNDDGVFTPDELVFSLLKGKGIRTTFCTWRWDNDPFLHGMDIKFSP